MSRSQAAAYYTESNLALVLVQQRFSILGIRWAAGLGWLQWDGIRWSACHESEVVEITRQWALLKATSALKAMKQGDGDKVNADAWVRVAGTAAKLRAVVSLTRGIAGVLTDVTDLDAHPDLLNTPTGIVDLRTGTLQPHDKDLLLTHCTVAGYVAGARHPDWDAALVALPEQVRGYAQLRYGQAITGHMTPDDVLLVQQGSGENGKTTVMGAIATAIGDYYTHVSDRVLLANPTDHPTELMDLRGARLALVEETPEARRLSVGRLKKIVGTPRITARYIRQDSMTFEATHTLIVSTNYLLNVDETDHGTWRRLQLLRYPYRFRKAHEPVTNELDRPGDPTLRHRVSTDPDAQAAVLAWLVDGAAVWYRMNRTMAEPPPMVVEDTNAWRQTSDQVLAYLDDRLVLDPAATVMGSELLEDFNAWLADRGQHRISDKVFVSRFGSHDALAGRIERKKVRPGAGLSRPTAYGYPQRAVPATFWGWIGVRFRQAADVDTAAQSPANTGVVPPVPRALHNPLREDYASVI